MNEQATMQLNSDDMANGGADVTLIVGLGRTGLSCARHLARRGEPFRIVDSRPEPPALDALRQSLPEAEVHCGPFTSNWLDGCSRLVLSPGLPADDPFIAQARARGIAVMGDIDLFAAEISAPVLAVTGSNGKSTVVALLGEMARQAGFDVAVGGNIGTPVLDLLDDIPSSGLYVLELSSFQLASTQRLAAHAAAILNITPDHLDHHTDMAAYRAAKYRLADLSRHLVVPRQDAGLMALGQDREMRSFGLDAPAGPRDYGIRPNEGRDWFMRGDEPIMPVDDLEISGRHNHLNALAALALFDTLDDADRQGALRALRDFRGLPHRMQLVAEHEGVLWIDDSKATNVGATEAALMGIDRPVVLIAGGQAKGADLSALAEVAAGRLRAAVLLGVDADRLAGVLSPVTVCHRAVDIDAAVRLARHLARPGEVVLLSPACASLDMFAGYAQRGEAFVRAVVRELGL